MELLLPNMTTTLMAVGGMLVALPCLQMGRADRCAMGPRNTGTQIRRAEWLSG